MGFLIVLGLLINCIWLVLEGPIASSYQLVVRQYLQPLKTKEQSCCFVRSHVLWKDLLVLQSMSSRRSSSMDRWSATSTLVQWQIWRETKSRCQCPWTMATSQEPSISSMFLDTPQWSRIYCFSLFASIPSDVLSLMPGCICGIFVIDGTKPMVQECCEYLYDLFVYEPFVNNPAPLIILVNKQDCEGCKSYHDIITSLETELYVFWYSLNDVWYRDKIKESRGSIEEVGKTQSIKLGIEGQVLFCFCLYHLIEIHLWYGCSLSCVF